MLLSTAYAPPIQFFAKLVGHQEVFLEACEYYIKQTYRNRCCIAGAEGIIDLTIPVRGGSSTVCPIREVRLSDHGRWRHRHWEAIRSAYGSSAFFEHYVDEIAPFYTRTYSFLWDLNFDLIVCLTHLLGLDTQIVCTESYRMEGEDHLEMEDFRSVIKPKSPPLDPTFRVLPYYQTFASRNGFVPGLSVYDLLFELGPESILLLRASSLSI